MSATRELLIGLRRSPLLSALAVVTIAFALFAVGLFGLVAVNIERALQDVEERVEIRAVLEDGVAAEQRVATMQALGALPEVATVDYVSPEQALERARQELGEFSDVFESEFLPAAYEVRLKPGFRDPAHVRGVATRIAGQPGVEDVRYGQDFMPESHHLMNYLTSQAAIPEYQVRLKWRPNTVAMWDNLQVQHYAVADYGRTTRKMLRATISGTPLA